MFPITKYFGNFFWEVIHIVINMNVKELRERYNLTQHQLADDTGIPRDRIAKWEQEKGSPKFEDKTILERYFAIKKNQLNLSLEHRDNEHIIKSLKIGVQLTKHLRTTKNTWESASKILDIPAISIQLFEKGLADYNTEHAKKIAEWAKIKIPDDWEDVPRETNYSSVDLSIRKPKISTDEEKDGITFLPISAQAGYPKRFNDPLYTRNLEKLFIPGFPYRGERYRIWEVEGNSMEPRFREGFYVLTEKVEQESWHQVKEHHVYVIVTEDDVLLKRVAKSVTKKDHWTLVSDNEELYPQFLIPIEIVKELWFVKRKMDWEMSPPKRFEIKL